VIAISSFGHGPDRYRLGGKPRLAGLADLEAIIALKPDLVLTSNYGDQLDRVTRLREAGLTVCDLSSQCGLRTLLPNARAIATLLGVPERGERFARGLERRMRAVAAGLPADMPRRRALYVGVYGGELYGGTVGSSYHDVLTAAGLSDCAAATHRGWPKLGIEELIVLAPEVIVMKRGAADALRQLPGAGAIAALRRADGVLEIDGELLEDPGPLMLEAAEALFDAAYPRFAAP
jgi:iron complex transport system substrate-binding protein